MANSVPARYAKTTYKVNGVEYRSIDEVPAEFRGILNEIGKSPPKDSKVTVTKQNILFSNLSEKAKDPKQKKFLEELVLPNLHLMDDKAKNEVLRDLYKTPTTPRGFFLRLHPLFWVALGMGIPILLLILFGR